MPPSRRALLGALSGIAFAGCLGSGVSADDETETPPPEPTRGAAPAIEVRREIARPEIEYLNDSDAIRYVAAYRHANQDEVENGSAPTREPVYETIPFDEWVHTEAASVGSTAVFETIDERTEGSLESVSAGVSSAGDDLEVVVHHQVTRDRDGDVIFEPSIRFERLVEVTPSAVTATVALDGHEGTETFPVVVEHVEIHQQ
jgi:hypothetical protein